MVLVLDGGVVSGPPGSSVLVTPIADGGVCPGGGVRVTQLSDGGITNLCNGAPGAQGLPGLTGPAGAPGASVSSSALAVMSAACPTGGLLLTFGDGGTAAVCNGAQGATGPIGATGPQGPAGAPGQGLPGAQGPAGPQGPPGPALYLDGGVVNVDPDSSTFSFAGYTAAVFDGNLGGYVGANQKCNAEFSGSHLCTLREWIFPGTSLSPGANGAWVDDYQNGGASYEPRDRSSYWTCGDWRTNNGPGTYTKFLDSLGSITSAAYNVCNVQRPLACCRSPHLAWFRGFTVATYDGNLGGYVGANQKCSAEFPGAHLCTLREYDWSGTSAMSGAAGAWVDDVMVPSSSNPTVHPRDRSSYWTCGDWRTNNGPGTYTKFLDQQGSITSAAYNVCNVARQLACCGR